MMKRYFVKQNKLYFILSVLLITVKTILAVLVAVLLSSLINAVSNAILTGSMADLKRILMICIVYAIGLGITVWLMGIAKAKCLKNAMVHLKEDAMSAIISQKIQEYKKENKGTYISLFNHNINLLEENYFKNIFSIYESIVGIVVAGLVLVLMNPIVAVFSIVCMCIPSLIPKLFSKKLSEAQSDAALKTANYNTEIKEILDGYETVKNYSLEEKISSNYLQILEAEETAKYRREKEMSKLYGVANMTSVITQFVIMLFAGFLAVKGYITIGSIVAVTQLSGQVISPAFQLSAKFGLIKSVKQIAADMMKMIEKTTVEKKTTLNEQYEEKNEGHEIRFLDVSFAYESLPVLEGVSFTLEKGRKYALTGESGSGKSTILKLLMQYYDSYKGKIMVDDKCLAECNDFFKECAYVGQEVFLFNDTLENNLCLFKKVNRQRLNSVIKKTGLEKVVEKLPEGLQTNVGENGGSLSGGERQRIAIARALLHNKKILLFDEATSALDAEMAEKIEELILELEDVTCLFVSHKLSENCVNQYEKVLHIKNKKIECA